MRVYASYVSGAYPGLMIRGDINSDLIEKMRDFGSIAAFNREGFKDERGYHEPYVQIFEPSQEETFKMAMKLRDELKKQDKDLDFSYSFV